MDCPDLADRLSLGVGRVAWMFGLRHHVVLLLEAHVHVYEPNHRKTRLIYAHKTRTDLYAYICSQISTVVVRYLDVAYTN